MTSPKPARGGAPPPVIEGYRIDGVLGRGATGVVYLARQLSVDREVALKVLHPDLVRNMRSVKRLQREARTAARLTHTNLISAIDMGQTGGTWWFAMELVHGESLAQRIERGGRLRESVALPIFVQVCEGLQHACEMGVVHRDIKPENILLEKGDVPRVVDLGLARVEDDPMLTRTGATLGTPHYISPEQARDPVCADVRSDIWSLGATMFHALCGQPPFGSGSTAEILSGVLYGAIPDPLELRPNLSPGMALVLRKCLSRDPNRRYFNPSELAEDLKRVLANKAPAIKRRSLEPLDPERITRRARGLAVTVTLGAVAIGVVALLIWRPWSGPASQQPKEPIEVRTAWAPIVRLRTDVEEGKVQLASAYRELAELQQRALPEARSEVDEARVFLQLRLEKELGAFWSDARVRVERLLEQHNFAGLEEYLDEGLGAGLTEKTGFTPESLPRDRDQVQFTTHQARYRETLLNRRNSALSVAVGAVRGHFEMVFLPKIDSLQRGGDWREARRLLSRDFTELHAESGGDLRGLDAELINAQLADLRTKLATRTRELNNAWYRLDSETLVPEVGRLADEAVEEVESRRHLHRAETFHDDFLELLDQNRLTEEMLRDAPDHYSLDYFEARLTELENLEEKLLQLDARRLLKQYDEEVAELYTRRNYRGAEEFWLEKLDLEGLQVEEAWDTIQTRLEETRALIEFLDRAVASVLSFGDRRVSFTQRNIGISGEVKLEGDPREHGFRLVISKNSSPGFLLRPGGKGTGEVLDSIALARFANEGFDPLEDRETFLQNLLFLYREGNYTAAERLLHPGSKLGRVRSCPFPPISLLETDIADRIELKVARAGDQRNIRKKRAIDEFERVLDKRGGTTDPLRRAREIGRILMEYSDVYSEDQEALLRARRRELKESVLPFTVGDFVDTFGTKEVSFTGLDRVQLRFTFDASEVGLWQAGQWYFNGSGWTGPAVRDLADLDRLPVPTLLLRDPLAPTEKMTEVTLRLWQPEDSPPKLFMISVLGFHVACVGPGADRGASVLADTTDLKDVASRAREGEGVEFKGLASGAEHTIELRLSRASGKIVVTIDGEQLLTASLAPSRDYRRSSTLSFRSFEPVEVREVVLETVRR